MSGEQMFLFGSFTLDEIQKLNGQSSTSPPVLNGGFRFGSLEFPLELLESSLSALNVTSVKKSPLPDNKKGTTFPNTPSPNGTAKNSNPSSNGVINNKKDNVNTTNLQNSPKKPENSNGVQNALNTTNLQNFPKKPENSNGVQNALNTTNLQNSPKKSENANGVQNAKKETPNSDPKPNGLMAENGIPSKTEIATVHDSTEEKDQIQNGVLKFEKRIRSNCLLPRGLINTGNTCFLNATLQALLSCPPFVELIQDLRDEYIPKGGYPTLGAFIEFVSNFDMPIETSSKINGKGIECGKSLSPLMFDSTLRSFTPDLPTGISARPRQEDAQEFLSFMMDEMHNELLKFSSGSEKETKTPLVVSSDEEDVWETVGPKNKTAITRTQSFVPSRLTGIFGGQLKSIVKAIGNKASATVQPFLLLHLDIFPDAIHTIEQALNLFSAPETLEGYRTDAGKANNAKKSVNIQALPKIMILHLMRFSYGENGSTKLHKRIWFPLQFSLGRELLATPTEKRTYELVSTITHHGREPSKGHYTADAKNSNGQWIRYDDGSVRAVNTKDVLQEQAYILFYKQI